jgi:hypothetical protein
MAKLTDEQRRVLRVLARHPEGCAEAVLVAQGFSVGQLAGLEPYGSSQGARSWADVHSSKCENSTLTAMPATAKSTTRTTLKSIFEREGFCFRLRRPFPDMLQLPKVQGAPLARRGQIRREHARPMWYPLRPPSADGRN